MACRHRFVFLRNESWYEKHRYCSYYYSIDFFFCEKCLEEKTTKKESGSVGIYEQEPDWALSITTKIDKT
jgi:hypothetical protein